MPRRLTLTGITVALLAAAALVVPGVTSSKPSRADALGGIYRGDDGGALYLRQVGANVYGFAEHPGQAYAFVLSGKVAGDRITGSWWDVPKGTRTLRGALDLRWSQGGARIVRAGGADVGPDVFTLLPPGTSIPWPGRREAGYQAKRWNDLDGAFRGNDASSYYARERNSNIVFYGEHIPQLGARPTWATVFIGTKTSAEAIRGVWVDLPKGTTGGTGSFIATRGKVDRSVALSQQGVSRATELVSDWAMDFDAYAKSMRDALDGNVVGYGWAVAKHGAVVRWGAGGSRRLSQDGGVLPFTPRTQNSAASTTKLVTAAAVMRLLAEKKLPVTAKVADYLPKCWKKTGKDIGTLTFQNLLDHSSKIDRALGQTACADDPYECLRRSIEAGQTGSAGYENINYTVFRYLVPLVENYKTTNAIFDKYYCGDVASQTTTKVIRGYINRFVSERFETYVESRVLKPFGIKAGYASTGSDWAYGYNFANQAAKGQAPNEKAYLTGGSGGMKWSADAYTRFLAALEGGKIVNTATARQMKAQQLGYDGARNGVAGSYYTKNGAAGNFASRAIVYPGRVVAYATVNSRNNSSASLASILTAAFDASLK